MIEEFTYQQQVDLLQKKNKISENKSATFVKGYRRLLKQALADGQKVEIEGWAVIYPSVRRSVMEVFDEVYDYGKQVEDLAFDLGMEVFDVHHLLKSYLRMLSMKLRMGYGVRILGVLYVKPESYGEGMMGYTTRLSPSLEKPEKMILKTKRVYGGIEELELTEETMIYRMELSESLGVPTKIRYVSEDLFDVSYIGDDVLG